MRYEEFRDVMLAKGYSVVDVMDCIRDFFRSDAADNCDMVAFNRFVAHCHGLDKMSVTNDTYDIDDAFDYLIDYYNDYYNYFHDHCMDSIFDYLCYDLWEDACCLDSLRLDDYWQDLLKDC